MMRRLLVLLVLLSVWLALPPQESSAQTTTTSTSTTTTLAGTGLVSVTVLRNETTPVGAQVTGRLVMSPGYLTGGDTFSEASVCASSARHLDYLSIDGTIGANHYEVDYANRKILARVGSTHAEVAALTNLSTVTIRYFARCR